MSAFGTVTRNTLLEHQPFTQIFAFKLFYVKILFEISYLLFLPQAGKILTKSNDPIIGILFDKNLYFMLTISEISLAPF